MNKRSAMMVAAGLVLALLVAGMAVAGGFTGPDSTSAGSRTVPVPRREPKVTTVTETVTVHRDAKAAGTSTPIAPVVVTRSPSSPASPISSTTDDDAFDDDAFDDDAFEDEDEHEDGEDHDDGDHEVDEHEDEDD